MDNRAYTIAVHVEGDPAEVEARVREALADEGFGVLTEIDVQATLAEKIGHEMPAYTILGACNPPLAKQAIEADSDIGGLLPCNVVVRAHPDGGTEVFAADPGRLMDLSPHAEALSGVARDARGRIERALASLAA